MEQTFSELYSPENKSHSNNEENSDGEEMPYLPMWLLQRAEKLGYTHPTLLQKRALDILLPKIPSDVNEAPTSREDDPDVILHAQTGSGEHCLGTG